MNLKINILISFSTIISITIIIIDYKTKVVWEIIKILYFNIFCIPITINNPLNACFSNKKYILIVKSENKLYENR